MKDFFGFNLEVPNTDTVLVQDLSKWLRLASHSAKCVIVLDALNQLDDGSGEEGTPQLYHITPHVSYYASIVMHTAPKLMHGGRD